MKDVCGGMHPPLLFKRLVIEHTRWSECVTAEKVFVLVCWEEEQQTGGRWTDAAAHGRGSW